MKKAHGGKAMRLTQSISQGRSRLMRMAGHGEGRGDQRESAAPVEGKGGRPAVQGALPLR
jgi:hypothetical protein